MNWTVFLGLILWSALFGGVLAIVWWRQRGRQLSLPDLPQETAEVADPEPQADPAPLANPMRWSAALLFPLALYLLLYSLGGQPSTWHDLGHLAAIGTIVAALALLG